jgi:predicted CXXCH cytochrome family protein
VRLVEDVPDLCITCHDPIEAAKAPKELHPPVEAGECTECHNPHASAEESLLWAADTTLCAACHSDVTERVRTASVDRVHPPVEEGKCRTCHAGHEGFVPGMLKEDTPGLCAQCHPTVVQRAQSEGAHPVARDEECSVCHDPHVGEVDGLLTESMQATCENCHDTQSAPYKDKHLEVEGVTGACTGCHDPHGSDKKGLLLAVSHAPYEDGDCQVCHGDDQKLTAVGAALCTSCHGELADAENFAYPHAAVTQGDQCLSCHSPHASRVQKLLVRDSTKKTCLSCHSRELFEGSVVHGETECTTCHAVHGSDIAGLLVENQLELCGTCHDAAEAHVHPYSGPAKDPRTGRELQCSSCHSPHSSNYPKLLTHDKDRELCVQCHLGPNLEVQGRIR